MRIAVTIGVYNEEKNIACLIESILKQTTIPDEVIIVDDGSKDRTAEIIKKYSKKNNIIKYIYQENSGPASARNKAWRFSNSDICIFTDGDCVPNSDWIEKLIMPFSDAKVGATAGSYRTINDKNILANFIGLEIEWRYHKIKGKVDVHGTYNLAVRKSVLEEIGGINEKYSEPSGEDWDMTYKISQKYDIIYVPEAIVGHHHPEKFIWYIKNQIRKSFDRIKVYKDHFNKIGGDVYTGKIIKYQVLITGIFAFSVIFLYPLFNFSFIIPFVFLFFLFIISLVPFPYFAKRDIKVAFYSIPIQLIRNFAWLMGLLKGLASITYEGFTKKK